MFRFSNNSPEVDKSDSEARGEQPGQVMASNTQPGKSQKKKNSEYLEAAKRGDLQTVVTLLNSGANILCRNSKGNSALHLAAEEGRDEVVKALLDRGLDVNTRGHYDRTPLMRAAFYGHESTFNILLEAGADITCRDVAGDNVLHAAAAGGRDTIVKILLDRGLDIDSRDSEDKTPLMIAASQAQGATVKLLLDKGARLDLKNSECKSGLQIILDQQLIGQREEILDSMMKLFKNGYDEAKEQYTIKQKIKEVTSSSIVLRDCIKSLDKRFKWGSGKYWSMLFLHLFLLISGLSFYVLDISTDLKFSLHLFNQSSRNFPNEEDACRPDFESKFQETIDNCQTNFTLTKCLNLLQEAKTLGDGCFNKEQRFVSNPEEWSSAGIIAALHCAMPFLVSLIIWIIQNNFKICSIEKIMNVPVPIFSKIKNFHYTRKLFGVYTERRNSDKKRALNEINKIKWIETIQRNEAVVNLSHLIEATTEASFQFVFQTVYLMPTLFISFTAKSQGLTNWTDLFQWKIVSILFSFGTFALTFYNIR